MTEMENVLNGALQKLSQRVAALELDLSLAHSQIDMLQQRLRAESPKPPADLPAPADLKNQKKKGESK